MSFLKNFWFTLKHKRAPKLTDSKTKRLIQKHNQYDQQLVQSLIQKKMPSLKQLKYSGKLLSRAEKIIVRILWGIMAAAVIFIGVIYYLNFTPSIPASGGNYIEGLIGEPRYINPLFSSANSVDQDISSLVFNGLLRYDQEKGLIPDLAKEFTISQDQKTYTFILRNDVVWHDGQKFTSDDVIFTIDLIKEPTTRSPLYFNFKGVTVEKIDAETIRFILPEPFAPFASNLTVGIIPAHLWSNVSINSLTLSELNLKPIGTGPFKFLSFVKDARSAQIKEYQLISNETYFEKKPYLGNVTFKFYPSFEMAVDALNNKKLLGLSYLPKENRQAVSSNRTLTLHSLNIPQYTALFYNRKNNTLLKDAKVRKLLAHGIDKDKIINEILNSEAQKIDGPILPGQLGYSTDYAKYPFDLEYAKKTLNDSGWVLADYEEPKAAVTTPTPAVETPASTSDTVTVTEAPAVDTYPYQVRKKDKTFLEFDLTTIDSAEYKLIAEAIQENWRLLGVKINIILVVKENIYRDVIKPRDYQILLYSEVIGYDPDPYAFWHSSQVEAPGLNLALFADKKTDTLLEDARKTTDVKVRAEKYTEFQKIIANEVPAVFLFNQTYTYPQTTKLQNNNTKSIILPPNRFADITSWYLITAKKWPWQE